MDGVFSFVVVLNIKGTARPKYYSERYNKFNVQTVPVDQ